MSGNDVVDSGIPLPRMATVQPLRDFVLRVKWAEGPRAGREDFVDVSPAIFSYKVYRPLRDENLFLTGTIAEELRTAPLAAMMPLLTVTCTSPL